MQATRPPDRRTLHTVAYTALALIVLLSILGVLKSPWLLVAVWTLHPVWDLAVHRDLDPLMKDLPVACLIYDLIIAAYLAFRTWRGHLIAAASFKVDRIGKLILDSSVNFVLRRLN